MINLELNDALVDAALIDELGVPTIVKELDIMSSGARNSRSRGIPDHRRDDDLDLLARRRNAGVQGATL